MCGCMQSNWFSDFDIIKTQLDQLLHLKKKTKAKAVVTLKEENKGKTTQNNVHNQKLKYSSFKQLASRTVRTLIFHFHIPAE